MTGFLGPHTPGGNGDGVEQDWSCHVVDRLGSTEQTAQTGTGDSSKLNLAMPLRASIQCG